MSLFDDDLGGTRRRGSLYKFSWVEEQRKSLQVLQERSLEKSTRRQADSDPAPLNLEDFRTSLITRSESARSSAEGQPQPPPPALPATSNELDGPGKRQSVKLSEGEVDPLSAIMSGAAVVDYDEEGDQAQAPALTSSSTSERVPGAASSQASGPKTDLDDGVDDSSDDQDSDPVVRRRANRLVFSLTLYLVEVFIVFCRLFFNCFCSIIRVITVIELRLYTHPLLMISLSCCIHSLCVCFATPTVTAVR